MTIVNLLKLEKIKAVNMRLPLILLIYFILSTGFSFVFFYTMTNIALWKNLSVIDIIVKYMYSDSFIFFAIITIINVGTDYNKKIYAKQFVSGISKNNFIISKFLFIAVFAIVLIFIELIKFFILQYLLTQQLDIDVKMLYKITFGLFLLLFIIGSYSFLIITISRKTILSIVIIYVFYKAESMLGLLTSTYGSNDILNFLPVKVVENIVNNFIMDTEHFVALFIYFLASVFLTTFLLNKNEISLN